MPLKEGIHIREGLTEIQEGICLAGAMTRVQAGYEITGTANANSEEVEIDETLLEVAEIEPGTKGHP